MDHSSHNYCLYSLNAWLTLNFDVDNIDGECSCGFVCYGGVLSNVNALLRICNVLFFVIMNL